MLGDPLIGGVCVCVCVCVTHCPLSSFLHVTAQCCGRDRGDVNEGEDPTSAFKGLTLKMWIEVEL